MNEFRAQMYGNAEKKPLFGKKRRRDGSGGGLTDVAVPRQEARTIDTRSGDRHRLADQSIIAIHRRRRHEVELINLSGGGAMISAEFEPKLWDRVDLDFGETGRIEGAVRWVKNERIGLEFAHETQIDCSPEERVALLRDVIRRGFPDVEIADRPPAACDEAEPSEEAEEPGEDGRLEPRHPLIWSGKVRLNHHEAEVRLRNVSSRGVQIQSEITFYPETRLLLDLGNAGSFAATVAWAVGDQAGLLFDNEFDMQSLAASTPRVAPFEWDAPSYLREAAKDSPWEESWGRVSIEELANSLEGFLKR